MDPVRAIRPVGDRSIHVIDGAFDSGFVAMFAQWLAGRTYSRSDYDTEGARDFLHFKHEFALPELEANPFTRQIARTVDGEIRAAYGALSPTLDRAHVNLTPYGDHFAAHVDGARGVTAILFANAEWREEWQGETLFYADGEAVAAVAPRPGRVALLPADMLHRVGAPSRLFAGARYTIAFKYRTAEVPA